MHDEVEVEVEGHDQAMEVMAVIEGIHSTDLHDELHQHEIDEIEVIAE